MRRIASRRLLAATAAAALVLTAGASAAQAATADVEISPAGAVTGAGTLRFWTDNHSVTCDVTVAARLNARASGEIEQSNLATSPVIGQIDSIGGRGCTPAGASVELANRLPLNIYYRISITEGIILFLHDAQFRIVDAAAGINCTIAIVRHMWMVQPGYNTVVDQLPAIGGGSGYDGQRSGTCDTGLFDSSGALTLSTPQTIRATEHYDP